jgi:hypothetical protein
MNLKLIADRLPDSPPGSAMVVRATNMLFAMRPFCWTIFRSFNGAPRTIW